MVCSQGGNIEDSEPSGFKLMALKKEYNIPGRSMGIDCKFNPSKYSLVLSIVFKIKGDLQDPLWLPTPGYEALMEEVKKDWPVHVGEIYSYPDELFSVEN